MKSTNACNQNQHYSSEGERRAAYDAQGKKAGRCAKLGCELK
jgi:hypothetical protein